MARLALVRTTPSEMAEAAEGYISRGWALIPFSPKSKDPFFEALPLSEDGTGRTWKPLAKEPATTETVKRWLEQEPNINLGVICGQASGIIIIDTDKPLKWPMQFLTPVVKTRRGFHYYLRTDRAYKSTVIQNRKGEHIGELRAEGNVTIIPPSLHVETRKPYEWIDGLSIDDIPMQPISKDLLKALVKLNPGLNDIALIEDRKRIEARKNILSCFNGVSVFNSSRDTEVYKDIPYIEYLRDPRVALTVMKEIGVEVYRIGQAFLCPIHKENNPSAALYLPHDQGFITMHDFHTGEFIPLPDLYAAHIKGKYKPLGAGERALWWIRCLVDLGYIDYPRMLARSLPDDAPESAQILYSGFLRLLGIRKLYDGSQEEAPFSWRFAAGWCGGLTNYKIKQGMAWLLGNGYLHKRGTTTSRTTLFGLIPVEEAEEPKNDIPKEEAPVKVQDGSINEKTQAYKPRANKYRRFWTATGERSALKMAKVILYPRSLKSALKMDKRRAANKLNTLRL